MEVEVKLFAIFREGRFTKKTINLSKGSHISDVLSYLKIPEENVGILLLNGQSAAVDCKLNASDSISLFPSIAGG